MQGEPVVVPPHSETVSGHVLVVDDDSLIREATCAYLSLYGDIRSQGAPDGLAGCEMAIAARDKGWPYDLILMDMNMPELDGYEATRRLRRFGWGGPIVALTGEILPGDREKCLDAGCDEYVPKQFAVRELPSILHRYLPKRSGNA